MGNLINKWMGLKNSGWFINYYHCKDCDEFWQMEWDADCDDKCPKCHSAYTPYKSEEHNDEKIS